MQINLLFLPLLGGYLFYTRCHLTAYSAKVCDGHRLIFHAAGFALIFCIAARLIVVASTHLPQVSDGIFAMAAVVTLCAALVSTGAIAWAAYRSQREKRRWKGSRIAIVAVGILLVLLSSAFSISYLRSLDRSVQDYPCHLAGGVLAISTFVIGCSKAIERLTDGRNFTLPTYAVQMRLSYLILIAAGIIGILLSKLGQVRVIWPEILAAPLSGTAAVAFLIGLVSWWTINLVLPMEFAAEQLHRSRRSDAQGRLIYEAAINQSLIQVTLLGGKVYVGWVDYIPLDSRAEDSFLRLLPLMSGYRDPTTKKVVFQTKYTAFIEREDFEPADYVKVFSRSSIEMLGRFREDVYEQFQLADAPDLAVESSPPQEHPQSVRSEGGPVEGDVGGDQRPVVVEATGSR